MLLQTLLLLELVLLSIPAVIDEYYLSLACAFSPLYAVNIGKIVGGAIGGLIALLALITIIVLIMLKLRGLYIKLSLINWARHMHSVSLHTGRQKNIQFLAICRSNINDDQWRN